MYLQEILPKFLPNKRIFADLSITDALTTNALCDDDEQENPALAMIGWRNLGFCMKSML